MALRDGTRRGGFVRSSPIVDRGEALENPWPWSGCTIASKTMTMPTKRHPLRRTTTSFQRRGSQMLFLAESTRIISVPKSPASPSSGRHLIESIFKAASHPLLHRHCPCDSTRVNRPSCRQKSAVGISIFKEKKAGNARSSMSRFQALARSCQVATFDAVSVCSTMPFLD